MIPAQPGLPRSVDFANAAARPDQDINDFATILAAAGTCQSVLSPFSEAASGTAPPPLKTSVEAVTRAIPQLLATSTTAVAAAGPKGLGTSAEIVAQHGNPVALPLAGLAPVSIPQPAATANHPQAPLLVQAALLDPTGDVTVVRQNQPAPAARIFNQDGFFGTNVATDSRDSARTTSPFTPPDVAPPNITDATTPGQVDRETLRLQPASVEARLAFVAPPLGREARGAVRVNPGQTQSVQPGLRRIPHVIDVKPEAEQATAKPPVRRLLEHDLGAKSAVRVALHALEQGLHVAAQVEGLDATDLEQLRVEIISLLARHGLSARSIRISVPNRGTSRESLK